MAALSRVSPKEALKRHFRLVFWVFFFLTLDEVQGVEAPLHLQDWTSHWSCSVWAGKMSHFSASPPLKNADQAMKTFLLNNNL